MKTSRYVIAGLILLGALAADKRLDSMVALAASRSEEHRVEFAQFPTTVGDWRVDILELSDRELELLEVDDYLRADFRSPLGRAMSVYVGYYTNPDRATQHPPTICYPGAGWRIEQDGLASLEVSGLERRLPVTITVFERGDQREMVVYWYSLSGYTASTPTWQKIARLRSIFAGRPISGASKIQIAVSMEGGRDRAKQDLQEFLAAFLPALNQFIPQNISNGG